MQVSEVPKLRRDFSQNKAVVKLLWLAANL